MTCGVEIYLALGSLKEKKDLGVCVCVFCDTVKSQQTSVLECWTIVRDSVVTKGKKKKHLAVPLRSNTAVVPFLPKQSLWAPEAVRRVPLILTPCTCVSLSVIDATSVN